MKTENRNTGFEAEVMRELDSLNNRIGNNALWLDSQISDVKNKVMELVNTLYTFIDIRCDDEIKKLRHECAARRVESERLKKRLEAAYQYLPQKELAAIVRGEYD